MNYDTDKIDEHTLTLLHLVVRARHEGLGARAWKGFDWDTMNRLHEKGYISNPVCTGSLLLGFAGLLDGYHGTTHWGSLDWMRKSLRAVTVEYDKHVVEDGRILTSAGISAGIDMALKVVARCYGESIARATAKHMEYPYPDNNARRIQF